MCQLQYSWQQKSCLMIKRPQPMIQLYNFSIKRWRSSYQSRRCRFKASKERQDSVICWETVSTCFLLILRSVAEVCYVHEAGGRLYMAAHLLEIANVDWLTLDILQAYWLCHELPRNVHVIQSIPPDETGYYIFQQFCSTFFIVAKSVIPNSIQDEK